jgi:cytosine/adenosine deaminase-related metal-dependent hydrolase
VEYYNGVVIPALVNGHCHLELSYMRGGIARGGGFTAFVAGISRLRAGVSPEAAVAAASYWDVRMAADGVGLVGDICNGDVTFAAKAQSSLRYHSFVELFGFERDEFNRKEHKGFSQRAQNNSAYCDQLAVKKPFEQSVAALLNEAAELGLEASTTPHSTYSLGDAKFTTACDCQLSTFNFQLSIHFMESRAERELFRKRGELWESYRSQGFDVLPDFDLLRWGSPVERLCGLVPAQRRIMLIHNTFLEQDELDALQNHFGDNLTLVLCPRSNLHITGQLPPVEMLRRSGVRIAVGTDSLATNASLSMVDELKLFTDVPLEELLQWATASGAAALGMEQEYGAIEVGRPAHFALLEGVDFATMTLRPDAVTRKL